MMDCACDYDPPEWARRAVVCSRKPRKCEECRGSIGVGDRYEYVAGKWDGDILVFETCERCVDLRQWAKNNLPCLCWAHGNLDDDIANAIDEAISRAPGETIGLRFGFLRRKVERARFNRTASGLDRIAGDLAAEAAKLRADARRLRDDADEAERAAKEAKREARVA